MGHLALLLGIGLQSHGVVIGVLTFSFVEHSHGSLISLGLQSNQIGTVGQTGILLWVLQQKLHNLLVCGSKLQKHLVIQLMNQTFRNGHRLATFKTNGKNFGDGSHVFWEGCSTGSWVQNSLGIQCCRQHHFIETLAATSTGCSSVLQEKSHKLGALDFKLLAIKFQDLLCGMSQIALNAHASKSMQHQHEMDFQLSSSQKYIHFYPSRCHCSSKAG